MNADCDIPMPFRAGQYVAVLSDVTLSAPVCSINSVCFTKLSRVESTSVSKRQGIQMLTEIAPVMVVDGTYTNSLALVFASVCTAEMAS